MLTGSTLRTIELYAEMPSFGGATCERADWTALAGVCPSAGTANTKLAQQAIFALSLPKASVSVSWQAGQTW